MKRNYSKPSIVVEPLSINNAVASRGCDYKSPDYLDMLEWGFFTSWEGCANDINKVPWGENTLCLNTNVIIALTS